MKDEDRADDPAIYLKQEDYQPLVVKGHSKFNSESGVFHRKFDQNTETGAPSEDYDQSSFHEMSYTSYTVDQLLSFAGDFGKMQWYCFFAVLIANLGISMYYYHFPYLGLMPRFTCKLSTHFGA
jgi:hypothetical protein